MHPPVHIEQPKYYLIRNSILPELPELNISGIRKYASLYVQSRIPIFFCILHETLRTEPFPSYSIIQLWRRGKSSHKAEDFLRKPYLHRFETTGVGIVRGGLGIELYSLTWVVTPTQEPWLRVILGSSFGGDSESQGSSDGNSGAVDPKILGKLLHDKLETEFTECLQNASSLRCVSADRLFSCLFLLDAVE